MRGRRSGRKRIICACAGALLVGVALLAPGAGTGSTEPAYEGQKKCGSCHRSERRSWAKTVHARALDSLKAGAELEAKRKVGLDPAKDYSSDRNCIGCHVTGFGKEGGYDPADPGIYLVGVGCESCHGPGSRYKLLHREAAEKFEKTGQPTPRQALANAGQEFGFLDRCNACHMNYEGSPWKGTRKPFTPFSPQVDPKYRFDFDKAVRNDAAMHEHFRLEGVFTGPPLPPFHKDFQAKARPVAKESGE
ncbi:MAG: Cytochrome c-554 [Steroidobacteraceae bacterium]|nr:Cytochrome c-554 [Steroidobacteraceae bacterium]